MKLTARYLLIPCIGMVIACGATGCQSSIGNKSARQPLLSATQNEAPHGQMTAPQDGNSWANQGIVQPTSYPSTIHRSNRGGVNQKHRFGEPAISKPVSYTFREPPRPLETFAVVHPSMLSDRRDSQDEWLARTHLLFDQNDLDLRADRAPNGLFATLWEDQQHFYSRDSLIALGMAFGAGAIMANTDIDSQLHSFFHDSVKGAVNDNQIEIFHKELGNGLYTIPLLSAAWIAGEYIDGPEAFESVGLWGQRSMRAYFVGAGPMLVGQKLTGASRPYEIPEGSAWRPLQDNNGVSGHAFIASVPFITAAKMTDNPWAKSFWYTASVLGPLSRVHDDAHYPSQVVLGWTIGYLSATAVTQTDNGHRNWRILPNAPSGSSGLSWEYRW